MMQCVDELVTRPKILVTNDDGYASKGLERLVEWALPLGDVTVVAPNGPRSGQSGAITANQPVRLTLLEERNGLTRYKTNGTPVDCVKLAMHHLFEGKPDLLLSGINHGSNAGVSILYSGTMGAVLEGCVEGIPSIGFSLCSHLIDADFSPCGDVVVQLVKRVLKTPLPDGICLNVNIPYSDDLKGIRVCRQTRGYWTDEYERRIDPHGRDYFWLTGRFNNLEPDNTETDEWALAHNYVSVVPCKVDMTAAHYIRPLQEWLE